MCSHAASAQKVGAQTEVAIHGPAGATLFVDGRPSGKLPRIANLHLAAGPHRFQLSLGKQHVESGLLMLPASHLTELNLTMLRNSLLAVLHVSAGVLLRLAEQHLGESQRALIRQAVDAGARQEHAVLLGEESGSATGPRAMSPESGQASSQSGTPAAEPGDEAAYVLALKLHRTFTESATDYALQGELLDPRTGALVARAKQRLHSSDAALLTKHLTQLTRQLLQEAGSRAPEPLALKASSSRPNVGVNGLAAANTASSMARPTGALQAKRHRAGLLAAGSVLVGGGLALGGFATSAFQANAQCAEDDRGCGKRYDTLGIGAVLLGTGTAVAFAGTIVLAISLGKRSSSAAVKLRAVPQG